MDLELTGKVALVTGGSFGLGRAIAERLYVEGARVLITARRAEPLREAAEAIEQRPGGAIAYFPGDVTVPGDIAAMVARAAEWGRIDILVNNAGRSAAAPFPNVSDEQWQADLDLKLIAAIRLSRAAVPHMRDGGRILNITAIAGKHPGAASVPTSVSRAAGIALTKALSFDLAPRRITVNTVCIGVVKSAQWERVAAARGTSPEEFYAGRGPDIPLGRVGEAEEVADLVAFLASARAAYITGTAINIDGGLSSAV
jgi:NAD(P)-dependent dehydrogenase (short-subunit alcohol dehydrogenase family)